MVALGGQPSSILKATVPQCLVATESTEIYFTMTTWGDLSEPMITKTHLLLANSVFQGLGLFQLASASCRVGGVQLNHTHTVSLLTLAVPNTSESFSRNFQVCGSKVRHTSFIAQHPLDFFHHGDSRATKIITEVAQAVSGKRCGGRKLGNFIS